MSEPKAVLSRWDDVRLDKMRGGITRKFVHSDKMMVGQIHFKKGDSVPAHRHDNEQYTYVVVGAGEIVLIPSDLLHSARADEDTFELDIFCPPRRDWIDGEDAYMRQ